MLSVCDVMHSHSEQNREERERERERERVREREIASILGGRGKEISEEKRDESRRGMR